MIMKLKPNEEKIIQAITKMGRNVADISRRTGIPRTSLLYMLRKLKEKRIIRTVIIGKRVHWRMNGPQNKNRQSQCD